MSEVVANFDPATYPPDDVTLVGVAAGVTFGVLRWYAGNSVLYTSFGWTPVRCGWGANRRKHKQRALDEARAAFNAAQGVLPL